MDHIPDIGARHLAAVLSVAENRSFVAAAAQLKMSQPALTRTIKRVEDVLGVRLFERTTRAVRLTDAGREFVAAAQRIANDLRITAANMREIADQQRGQIVVSCILSVANSLFPAAVAAYRKAHPGVEIRIQDGIHGSIMDDVKGGAADFGLSYLQDTPDGVLTRRLGQGHFDLVASKTSGLVEPGQTSIRFDDLDGMPLISLPSDSQTRRVLDATAALRGVRLDHAVTVTHIPTLLSFVRARIGVGLVPSISVAGLLGDDLVRLSVRDPRISLEVGIVHSAERDLSPAAQGFLDMIEASWPDD